MTALTITEALAELKTIQKRIEKKRDLVKGFLARQDGIKDPLEKDGGSAKMVTETRQAIADLELRHVAIRTSIQKINQATPITIAQTTKTIAEWLTWRKEIAPGAAKFLLTLQGTLNEARRTAQQKGFQVISAGNVANQPTDLVVNIDEGALAKEAEYIEEILGTLDGQLSLKNATVMVELA